MYPYAATLVVFTITSTASFAQRGEVTAHLGTAVAYNQEGHGVSLGLGYRLPLSEYWSLRTEVDYAEGSYELSWQERIFAPLNPAPSTTRSFGLGILALRSWSLGPRERHRLDAGVGLQARWLRLYSITGARYVSSRGSDGALEHEPVAAIQGTTWQDKVGPAIRASYGYRVGARIRLGAYWRYEPNLMDEMELYQTIYNELDTGGSFGFVNGFLEHLDTTNAMSFGVVIGYALSD